MTPRAVWIALFASLAFNVFALGAFVGLRLAEAHAPIREGEPAASARGRNPLAEAVRALPPEAQIAWRAQNRTFMETAGPEIRESRRLTREALRGLGAEPFDPTAATAALQRARDAERDSRSAMDRRLIAFTAHLPPEDRRAFAEALARGADRGGPPRGGPQRPQP
jgi:uncharacterized membrane protein